MNIIAQAAAHEPKKPYELVDKFAASKKALKALDAGETNHLLVESAEDQGLKVEMLSVFAARSAFNAGVRKIADYHEVPAEVENKPIDLYASDSE